MIINRGTMNVNGGDMGVYTAISNEGTLNVNGGTTGLEYEFDNVNFHGVELVGNIPLHPSIMMFLKSKGNNIIQGNEKITFYGDFINTFTENEVTEFLTATEQSVSAPRPLL